MKSISSRRVSALLGCALASLIALAAPAIAAPDTNQNSGVWSDGFSDQSGLAEGPINSEDGHLGVVFDPFGSLITLPSIGNTGYFYTTAINPSSFSAWGKVYIDFTSPVANGVIVRVWTGTALVPLTLTASDNPAYARMASIAGLDPNAVPQIRLRVALDRGGSAIAPTVKDLKVTWVPKSVLAIALDAPTSRPAGDGIVLRVASSVSFVNATDLYVWIPMPTSISNVYSQNDALTFISATDGGQYTASPIGPVPANSVYWHKPTLAAGSSVAYYATVRSNNGLVNGLGYPFQARNASSNSTVSPQSSTITTRMTATPRGYLDKTSSGTFILSGQAYAADDALITLRLSAGNWVFTPIPNGSQEWNEAVIYDSVEDFVAKCAIGPVGAGCSGTYTPTVGPSGDIRNITGPNGQFTTVAIPSLGVPKNSVYWTVPRIQLGQLQSLSYQIKLNGLLSDQLPLANSVTINSCSGKEARFSSGQYTQYNSTVNACPGAGSSSCAPIFDCHPIIIHLNNTPGFAFGKGDMINGAIEIRTGINDNSDKFVTYGDPITFKLAVGNSALSRLNDVVMFDKAPASTTFSSASLPASAKGKVYYYVGTTPPASGAPAFFANPSNPADDSLVDGDNANGPDWVLAKPLNVTWVAFWLPRLSSTYFLEMDTTTTPATPYPSSVVADFTVTVNTTIGNPCLPIVVTNTGYAQFPRLTPLTGLDAITGEPIFGSETAFGNGLTSASDNEPVDVKPVLPNLSASAISGPPSASPGETWEWTVTVFDHDRSGNLVDIARGAKAVIAIPQVVANGVKQYLVFSGANATFTPTVDLFNVVTHITVNLNDILPQQSKSVTLKLRLPIGIRNSDTISVNAALTANDDFCGQVSANLSAQTSVTSAPAVDVRKDVDLTVVAPGTTYNYALRYINSGTAPSSQTVIVDRVPQGLDILSARGPSYGKVYFAADLLANPSDPGAGYLTGLTSTYTFDYAFVTSRFTLATSRPNPTGDPGLYTAPMANARWVAFVVDNPNFDPTVTGPILGVGLPNQMLDIQVKVKTATPIGTVLENEALQDTFENPQSIGNRVVTVVSARPGLALTKTCPDVISSEEPFSYRIEWINDTTNNDDTVTIVETFPRFFVPDFGGVESSEFVLPAPIIVGIDDQNEQCDPYTTTGCRFRASWSFPPQGSLGVAYLEIPGEFVGATSNKFASNEVVGIAENASGAFATSQTCTTLIQNPELFIQKYVDIIDPRSDETVTFTLVASNEHGRRAENVLLVDTLGADFTADLGSFVVLTPGWSIAAGYPAAVGADIQIRLKKDDNVAGYLPGNSGSIAVSYRATVNADVAPGTTILNEVSIVGTPGQDVPDQFPDDANVTVKTPLPDLYVTMTAPALVKPGHNITWSILFGNESREDANQTVLLVTFPPDPDSAGNAAFLYLGHTAPAGVGVYFSAAPLGSITLADTVNDFPSWPLPGLGTTWTNSPTEVGGQPIVNYMLFVIGDVNALQGPFPISISAAAFAQDGAELDIGDTFQALADIGMVAPTFAEEDYANNHAFAITRTPLADLKLTVSCAPDGTAVGLPPGAFTDFTITVENTGTVNSFGVFVDVDFDDILVPEADFADTVFVKAEGGSAVDPIEPTGARVSQPVTWTRVGQRFYLGTQDTFQQLGLKVGDSTSFTLRARVLDNIGNEEPFENAASVTTFGQSGNVQVDEVPENNTDACGSVVYRPDLFVIKSALNLGYCGGQETRGTGIDEVRQFAAFEASIPSRNEAEARDAIGFEGCPDANATTQLADAGDTLFYTVQFGNAGKYAASGVTITDPLPLGTTLISGSLSGLPSGVTAEYDDGSSSWTTQAWEDPTLLRLRWNDGVVVRSLPSGIYFASTAEDFKMGKFDDSYPAEDDTVRPLNGDNNATYISPSFPQPDEGNVTRWGTVTAKSTVNEGSGGLNGGVMLLAGIGSGGVQGPLYRIDPATAAATPIGSDVGFPLTGLSQNPQTGVLYAATSRKHLLGNGQSSLITVDLVTGVGTLIAKLINTNEAGCDDSSADISFRSDGVLFGFLEPCLDDLATINIETGESFDIGDANLGTFGSGLAFDSDGMLYYTGESASGPLRVFDTATGLASQIATLSGSGSDGAISALAVHPETNVLYGVHNVSSAERNLITINVTTGLITTVGPLPAKTDALVFVRAPSGIAIDVLDPNGTAVLTNILPDGTGTYDLSALSAVDHPELKLRARFSYDCQGGTKDIVPTIANFWGVPTGLNASGTAIGIQRGASGNLTAWTWEDPDANVTDMHTMLPVWPGVSASDAWSQSAASDINDRDGIIVGWAAPNFSYSDGDLQADACKSLDSWYSPKEAKFSWEGKSIEGKRFQWLIPHGDLPQNGTIAGFRLRDRGVPGPKTVNGLTVRAGFVQQASLGDSWVDTSVAGFQTITNDATLNWTATTAPADFDVAVNFPQLTIPLAPNGSDNLLIEMVWTGAGGRLLFEGNDNCGSADENGTLYSLVQAAAAPDNLSCPLSTEIIASLNREVPMVWRPSANPSGYTAQCLPTPMEHHRDVPSGNYPATSLVYVNEAGYAAASVGARRMTGETNPYGTATLYWFNPRASSYEAFPIMPPGPATGLPTLAGPAAVTGLGDDENATVIGVGIQADVNSTNYTAYAWMVSEWDALKRPKAWLETNLSSLLKAASPTMPFFKVTPLDIDALGNIVGVAQRDAQPARVIIWQRKNGAYAIADVRVLPPGDSNADAFVSERPFLDPDHGPLTTIMQMATNSIDAGRAYLSSANAAEYAIGYWQADSLTPLQPGNSLIFGSEATTALGVNLKDPTAPDAWANFDGTVVSLGTVQKPLNAKGFYHIPLHANADPQVIGSYFKTLADNDLRRVFFWKQCAPDESALEEWSVTYETDRPPQITFQVEVDDYCQDQITNRVDIATTTPEVCNGNDLNCTAETTLANNHSEVSVPLNKADLGMVVTADVDVVSPWSDGNIPVTFTAVVTNHGGGTSRDVYVEFEHPDSTYYIDASADWDYNLARYCYDDSDKLYCYLDALTPGQEFTMTWYGDHIQDEAGALLTASATADARTVDCNAENDTGSFGVVVGDYPNLLVTIDGPAFGVSGETLTYTIFYANTGNVDDEDANVTLVPPPGMVFLTSSLPHESGPGLVWDLGTLVPDESGIITVSFGAPGCDVEGIDGYFDFEVEIQGARAESNLIDNLAFTDTWVAPGTSELALDVVQSHAVAEAGEEVAATIYFSNPGTNTVGGATLRVGVPGGSTAYAIGSATSGGTLTGSTVLWNLGTLMPGEAGSVTFRYLATANAATTSITLDAIGACGASSNLVPPALQQAGLNIFKSASVGSVCGSGEVGASVEWTIVVTNSSASELKNVVVTDPLPTGMNYNGGIYGIGANANNPATLVWTIPSIPANQGLTLGYKTKVTATTTGVLKNSVSATLSATGMTLSTIGAIGIDCGSTPVLSKAWTGACQLDATPVGLSFTLKNGKTPIRNGKITDYIPLGLEVQVPTGNVPPAQQFSYDTATRAVTFTVGTLLANQSVSYNLSVVPSGARPAGNIITNRATLRADGYVIQTSNQVAGVFLKCNDGNVCTVDSCTGELGCVNTLTRLQGVVDSCDGIDNDCDASFPGGGIDEDFVPKDETCGQGVCQVTGTHVCEAGTIKFRIGTGEYTYADVCAPNTANQKDELCDDLDNDCDGRIDENFDLNVACSLGFGECKAEGVIVCDAAKVGQMCNATTAVTPTAELCDDAKDSDCDGHNDNGFELIGTSCMANEEGTDKCFNDFFRCNPENRSDTRWCKPTVFAQELCNAGDDNCNGVNNEGFNVGNACDSDEADEDLCKNDLIECDPGNATKSICVQKVTPQGEQCNGKDDNCNNQIDEDWTRTSPGQTGDFLGDACDGPNDADFCKNGVFECNIGFTGIVCLESNLGKVEFCNGVDDTCDCSNPALAGQACTPTVANHMIDEGFNIGAECMTTGLGACRVPGLIACSTDDNTTSECVANNPYVPGAETCNGVDDDCDGIVDNVPGTQTTICKPLETDIVTGPPAITASTTAVFTYINPLANPVASHTTFQCSLDGAAWTQCDHSGAVPSLTYTNLPTGQHTLLVRATRYDGAVDPTPDIWTWIIDTTVPDTTILVAPTNPSQNPSGTFVFGSPTPNPDFYTCVLDPTGGVCPAIGSASYAVCPTPYGFTGLADGTHSLCVYVTNTAGTPDPTPATYTWVIDTTAPETEIVTVIPPKVTNQTTVVFHYIDPTAPPTNTFECSLDGSAWTDCDGKTNTYTGLTEGEHVFAVRTVDPNGVVDPTPAVYTFIVDLTAPCPNIALMPSNPAQSGTAVFGFTATEAAVTYACALDARLQGNGEPAQSAYSPCAATATFSGLADGQHTLWVQAIDVAGNLGTCRANYAWLIDSRFPETEITAGPTPLTGKGEVSVLDYIDPTDEDLITFECSLDGATFTRCDGTTPGDGGTIEYTDLPVGQHTFEVRACDFTKAVAVQCDPTPATWTWQVTVSPCPNDRTAPAIACAGNIVLECVDNGASVDLDKIAPVSSDLCAPLATTTSASTDVVLGQNPIVYTSVDGNGNASSCVTLVTVVDVTAPTISCPADVLNATTDPGLCSASLAITAATGNDTCQGNVGLLVLNDAPRVFTPGETIVTHHVIDSFGNEATCEQTVVVTDNESLILTCSESATVDADADKCEWTGKHSALATDNCSDQLTIDVEGTYPVGISPILFTAADGAGNSDECTTQLTVRDVTDPVVNCGTPVGVLPTVIRATATDACGTKVTIENVVCSRVVDGVSTEVALTNCPININADSIEITGRLSAGELVITYDARAVDPSGNSAVTNCTQAYDPDQDNDGVIDAEDNCPLVANGDQTDSDGDGIGDLCDVCPDVNDPAQADRDGDGIGDACSDKDKDGVLDIDDNCEVIANADQLNSDGDEMGDLCDPTPYEGLTAEGDGGCAGGGGAGGLLGGLSGLLGIFMAMRARRR